MASSLRSASTADVAVRVATERSPQAVVPDLGGLILRIDARGAVLDYGAAGGCGLAGELQARRIDQVLPGEVAASAMRALAAALESGSAQSIEYAGPVGGGRRGRFEARFAPTRGGQCLVVITAIAATKRAKASLRSRGETSRGATDLRAANRRLEGEVEEHKRSMRALRRSEARLRRPEEGLRSAVESLSDAFVLWDAEDRLVFCNARFKALYPEAGVARPGVRFEALMTRLARSGRIVEAVGQEDEWVAERQRQRRERHIAPRERRFADGRWVRICSYRTPDGGIVSLHTDITALKQREEALPERELQLRKIVDNVPGVVYRRLRHPDGRITFPFHSSQIEPRYGFGAAALVTGSVPLEEAMHPDDRAQWLAAIERSAADLTAFEVDYRFRSAAGDWRWVRSLATPTGRDDGSVSWDGISFDITELKATEVALRESEERYRRLVEAGPDAIVIHQGGRIRFASARAAELAGLADACELVGRPIAEFLHPAERATDVAPVQRRLEEGGVVGEARFRRAHGELIPVEVTAVKVAEGGRPAVHAVIRDISKRKRAQEALRESEERYRRLIETAPIALLTHRQGRIRFANAKAVDLLGVGLPSVLKGRSLISFVCPEDRPVVRLRMRRARERRGLVEPCELRLRRLDGTVVDVEFSAIAITEHGTPAVQVALLDVTARKHAEARIRYWAHHDALTGLPNRALLLDRLQQALAQARRDRQKLAVMMLDLDHFKDVNDTLGHPVGDQLLCAVAERLRSIVRDSDTLARFGGDELVLIQTGLDSAVGARVLAQKIVEAIAEPFAIDGDDVRTSCSLGIALFPEGGTVAETLLKNADMALYRAKARGRTSFEFYAEGMRAEVHTRRALEDDLRRALERREFRLLYQPQYNLGTERLVGVEALLRWYHPRRGVMRPQAFLTLAEGTSLIGPIARWVLEEACRQASAWAHEGTAVRVGVRLSATQCREPEFIDILTGLLARENLAPELLDLEVTESLFANPYGGRGAGTLRRLGELGIKISIDDFGTGHSSLGYLKRLRVDHIKLDSLFVEGIGRNPTDEAIARTVIALGRSLDKRVIAEGVGTEQQRLFLRDLGCDYAQGRLFGDAMPAKEIRPLLRAGMRGARSTRADLSKDRTKGRAGGGDLEGGDAQGGAPERSE